MDGQGNLERTWKVRENSFREFVLFKRGQDVLSHEIV